MTSSGNRKCYPTETAAAIAWCPLQCAGQGVTCRGGGLPDCQAFIYDFLGKPIFGHSYVVCECATSNGSLRSSLRKICLAMKASCDTVGCGSNCKDRVECILAKGRAIEAARCAGRRICILACFSPSDRGYEGHMKAGLGARLKKRNCEILHAGCRKEETIQNGLV